MVTSEPPVIQTEEISVEKGISNEEPIPTMEYDLKSPEELEIENEAEEKEEEILKEEDVIVEVPQKEDEISGSEEQCKYDPRLDLSRYVFPTRDLLKF